MARNPREDGGPGREPRNAAGSVAVTRVALRNYRSIAACDVALPPLAVLVGPNGSGKSNFLDALRFIAQALRFSPEHALRERGGINEVRRRSRGHPNHFAVRVDFRLPDAAGHYAFEIGARPRGRYFVRREHCFVWGTASERSDFFRIEDGRHRSSSMSHPPPAGGSDRLYLLPASTYKAFRPVYDTLAGMGFYNLNPAQIRELQSPDPGDLLDRDGGNIASVLDRMKSDSPSDVERIGQYLASVVPGTYSVEPRTVGPKLTLEFRQRVRSDPNPWRFLANNVSDGTLRVLGVLAALFQRPGASRSARPGVCAVERRGLLERSGWAPSGAAKATLGGRWWASRSRRPRCIPPRPACSPTSSTKRAGASRSSSPATARTCWTAKRFRWNRSWPSYRKTAKRRCPDPTKPAASPFATVCSRWASCCA